MKEIIECKDCKFFLKMRTEESANKYGQIYECTIHVQNVPSPNDYCSRAEKKESNR